MFFGESKYFFYGITAKTSFWKLSVYVFFGILRRFLKPEPLFSLENSAMDVSSAGGTIFGCIGVLSWFFGDEAPWCIITGSLDVRIVGT